MESGCGPEGSPAVDKQTDARTDGRTDSERQTGLQPVDTGTEGWIRMKSRMESRDLMNKMVTLSERLAVYVLKALGLKWILLSIYMVL